LAGLTLVAARGHEVVRIGLESAYPTRNGVVCRYGKSQCNRLNCSTEFENRRPLFRASSSVCIRPQNESIMTVMLSLPSKSILLLFSGGLWIPADPIQIAKTNDTNGEEGIYKVATAKTLAEKSGQVFERSSHAWRYSSVTIPAANAASN